MSVDVGCALGAFAATKPVAAGDSNSIPADLSGWTVEPQPERAWGFTVRDGMLCVRVKGRGAILVVKFAFRTSFVEGSEVGPRPCQDAVGTGVID